MTLSLALDTVQLGLVWGLVALGVYLTFRVVGVPDLTVDGTLALGAATAARLIIGGTSPIVATLVAAAAGALGGLSTGLLATRGKIQPLLAGILTMTALYSINLRVMGRANITLQRGLTLIPNESVARLVLFLAIAVLLKLALDLFFRTDLGLALRATGDNEQMVRTVGVSSDRMKVLGLVLSNAIVGLAGALIAQYSGFADAQMGVGTVVIGLASLIIGEGLFGSKTVARGTLAVLLGSIVYRFIVAFALRSGLNATDLKLITSVLVIIALTTPQLRRFLRLST